MLGDGVSTFAIGLMKRNAAFFSAWARSTESFTAAESNGVPSLNLTPSRSLNVYVLPSLDTVHEVASTGRGPLRSSLRSSSDS